jgi:hypothetical protein
MALATRGVGGEEGASVALRDWKPSGARGWWAAAGVLGLVAALSPVRGAAAADRPHVVFILTDD